MAGRFKVGAEFSAIDRMTKPIDKIQRRLNKFTRLSSVRVQKLGQSFKKTGAVIGKSIAIGTTVAGAALTASILKTAELGDEAAKTARRLGITAESLQELRFAADRQGVSAGLLDSSFTALQKRVGELKAGAGSLYGFLKKTGDKAFAEQIARAKDTGEAFELVTKRVNEIEDPLKKAAFASAAFSRAGVNMLKFMEAGQDGIAKLRMEAQKYGAVISDRAAAQSEVFVDSLTNLKAALTGIGKTFSSKLIPFLSDAMQGFADFWAMNKKIISVGMDKFLKFLVDTFRAVRPGVTDLFKSLKQLFEAFWEAVNSLLPKVNAETADVSRSINLLTGAFSFLADTLTEVFRFISRFSAFIKPLITTFLIYKGLVITLVAVTKAWSVAQGILNAVMAANPFTLILIAVAALTTGIILLVQHWDTVVAAFKTGVEMIWNFLSGLLDNPFIAAAGVLFLPFLAIPALIVKHWEPIKGFFTSLWTEITANFMAAWENILSFFVGVWSRLNAVFSSGVEIVMDIVKPLESAIAKVGDLFSGLGVVFGGSEGDVTESPDSRGSTGAVSDSPQVITQAAQVSRAIEEIRETSSAELLIKDETGRAELSRSRPAPGVKIAMASSGGR